MGSDFLAAKLHDPLVHTSLLADFVSSLVKGAIYVAVAVGAAAAATAAVAATIGSGGTAGPVVVFLISNIIIGGVGAGFGSLIDDIADGAGALVDDALDFFGMKGKPDGLIVTGSPDVRIKKQPAARAAGKLPPAGELAKLEAEDAKRQDEDESAWDIAANIFFTLLPVAGLAKMAWDFLADPAGSIQEMVAPTVAGANPHATPADEDKITCTKLHLIPPDELFLAEGSRTVRINSQPACRNGDRSTCEAVISHVQSGMKVRIGGPSEVVKNIRSGKNPFMGLAADIVVGLLTRKALGKLPKKRKTEEKEPHPHKERDPNASCPFGGNPIHLPSGAKIQAGESELDFVLDGHIPLLWQRLYDSRNTQTGILGRGWRLPFETTIYRSISPDFTTPPQSDLTENSPDQFTYMDDAGRALKLGGLTPGDSAFYVDGGFRVWRSKQDYFLIQTLAGEYSFFAPDPCRSGHWRLERIMDRHLNSLTLLYDATGVLTHIHDDDHLLVVRLSYENERLHQVWQQSEDDSHERLLVSYVFSAEGQLTDISDANGDVTLRCEYGDIHGLIQALYYPAGRESHYRWQTFDAWTDEAGDARPAHWRVVEHWIQESAHNDRPPVMLEHYGFDYDVPGQCLRLVQAGRGESVWRWDAQGQVTAQRDESGAEWTYHWNTARKLLKSIDPLGNTQTFSYDEYGNIAVFTNALGQKTAITWLPGFSFPLRWIQPGQVVWSYEYNSVGDVISMTDPEGHITRLEWDTDGNNTVVHDAKGNALRYGYNRRGQVTAYRDCSERVTRWRYDEWGRVTQHINAESHATHYGYTATDRLHTLTRPDGEFMQFEYDAAGELVRHQDYGRVLTLFTRNARGQVTQRTDPGGYTLRYEYDPLGRLKRLFNEKGEAYRFEYDAQDNLIQETGLTGIQKTYRRDALGQVLTQTETPAEGGTPVLTHFEYDALGRQTARETPSRRTEYHYALHQTTVLDITAEGNAALRFDYDSQGRLLAEHNHSGVYRHEYDALGNRTAEHLPGGQTLRHLYYGSGHLLQTHLESDCGREVIAEYERDVLHREIRRTQGTLSQYRAYNICGHLTRQSCGRKRPELATPLLDFRYHRDARDNLLRVSGQYHPGLPERDRDTGALQEDVFSYDARGQVVHHEQDGHGRTFSYDAAMNGLGDSGYRQSPGLPDAPGNRLTACKEYRYRWDGFGRLAQRDNVSTGVKQRLHYDDSHRLIRVELLNDREWSKVEFSYDALDRRTEKRVWRHNSTPPVHTVFEWSGMRLCGERNDKVPLAHTLYLYEEGSWQPLARVDSYRGGSVPQQRVLYYHSLPNGFAPCLTNSEGEIVWRGRMQLWGTLRTEENRESYSMHPAHNLRFAGQYLDRETGLHYNTFRYYAPECGRFTQLDPVGLRGGLNLYQYAPNPLSWIDPLGLAATGDYGQMPVMPGYQKHHNIPQSMANHPAIVNSGYDINNSRNITQLPSSKAAIKADPGRTVHRGMHNKAYDDLVRGQLDAIHASNASPEIKRMQIEALSDDLGHKLRNKQIKLNKAC
ncbi:RHS repeat-associated core domain-containing protein [Kluyvera intermedia]|uniref:RHS repeat-associated core domain-containing protein n=1 Tax=Kluyvera intermedia TaxID=61648 RepID=UPI00243229E0|nr:RHS repeat-associated core domain-containing protein [Kluyvera intermedia]WEJ84365.1 MAG: DUF6531 domain-containing protein [Kluyvera intermedia]